MRRTGRFAIAMSMWLTALPAAANDQTAHLRATASHQLYSLDLDAAAETYRQAIALDPSDGAAHRGLASALWARTAFDRGTVTVDSFIGRVSSTRVKTVPPSAALAAEFTRAVATAIALARARLDRRRDDVDAVYEYGAAIGLQASYVATVDGSVLSALGAARRAFDAHERVLALNPARHDAGLTVGMYRYMVSALSRPVRMMAYIAGFGGDRERGLALVERAADYSGDSQTDARLALVLLYNRERRYDAALDQLRILRERYPANRLLWLEAGATALRAKRAADADEVLTDGIDRLMRDPRPRMFGEAALWYYKRGAARVALGRADAARADLERALASDGRDWVHGRTYLELGKLALAAGHRDEARRALQQAATLCDRDQDGNTAAAARDLMRH